MQNKNKIIICVFGVIAIGLIALIIIYNAIILYGNIIGAEKSDKDEFNDQIIQQICTDNFVASSDISKNVEQYVVFSIDAVRDDEIDVSVEYADVSKNLLTFMASLDVYTDDDFINGINKLLEESEPKRETFTLSYEIENEEIIIEYTNEFENAFSCGLTTFCDEYFGTEVEVEGDVYANLDNIGTYYNEKRYSEVPPITNDIVYDLLKYMPNWLTIQTKSFNKLSSEQKLEIAAVTALIEHKSSDGVSFKKSVIDDIMLKYFGMIPDYDHMNDTDLVRIKKDTVELFWGNADFQLNMHLMSVDRTDEDTVYAEVKYYYDFEGTTYEYSNVKYEIGIDPNLESYYYIRSCKLDYVFIGFDKLIIDDASDPAYINVFGDMDVVAAIYPEWENVVDKVVMAMGRNDYAEAKYECLPLDVIEVICRNNNVTYEELLIEAEKELKEKSYFNMSNYSSDCDLVWEIMGMDFEYVNANDYDEDYTANGRWPVNEYLKINIKVMVLGDNNDLKAQFYEKICLFHYDGGWGGFIE